MAEVAKAVDVPETLKSSMEPAITIAAASGTIVESAAAEGKVALTEKPKLGEPEAFFPANPAAVDHLEKNKPVKELKSGDRTASGGLLRSISDVITDLHKKHVERKRARAEEAKAGSPSQAKFRKGLEESADSPTAANASSAKPQSRLATSKSAGSGASDKVGRMTCWGTSDQAAPVKKPSLAERYSAWKAAQQEKRAARAAKSPAAPKPDVAPKAAAAPQQADAQTVVVEDKATKAEAAQVAKQDTPPNAGITVESLAV